MSLCSFLAQYQVAFSSEIAMAGSFLRVAFLAMCTQAFCAPRQPVWLSELCLCNVAAGFRENAPWHRSSVPLASGAGFLAAALQNEINRPMKQQNRVMVLCAAACVVAKIVFGNSFLAFVSSIASTFAMYILIKTLVDVVQMPDCSSQYREFAERMKCIETHKQK